VRAGGRPRRRAAIRLAPGAPSNSTPPRRTSGEKDGGAKEYPEVAAKVEVYPKTARTESKELPITAAKKKK
jgi:hypothetical protein